ncbi:amidohydrolase family protein [Croceicoccus sp. BE223]|uniref:amidohydrolase n=1 Tax=Croceicoccus sp. BE223 TaxID=2817716 RepID=UPI0028642DAB|nr:amidohydrolase family protein [Croceicoccus sp. BE223]MDR7101780.1 putative amidohydrolase YtcJ [Croceicoccus sp. BE223]
MTGRPPLSARARRASALLLSSIALIAAAPAMADTLVDNIQGIRVDASGKVERFVAMIIDPSGRVKETLAQAPKKPKNIDYRVDGKGRVLLPGFVDSHVHLSGIGFNAIGLDLSDTKTMAEALNRIADYARRNPNKAWIIGRGWNEVVWNTGRLPTAAELDAAVPDRPVWLERADGHAGWANSEAMRRAGVTAATKAPAGGRIDIANGQPSGIFVDAATALVTKQLPPPLPEERDLAFRKAQELLLSNGVTAVSDMGIGLLDWQAMRREGDVNRLSLRIAAYAAGVDEMITIAGPGPSPWLYGDRLKLAGIKIYLDGALGSRGAWLMQPYADMPSSSGLQLVGGTQLRNIISRAAMDDFQVAIHAIGDAANREALDAISEMKDSYPGDRRWRIEHAQVVDPSDLPRFAQEGVIASMQPHHQVSDRTMAEARLGPNRLTGAYAWKSMLNAKTHLAFGSDAPVEVPNVFEGIADAATRADANGQPFGGWQPQEIVSREDALAAYTAGGAYAMGAEGRFGTLAKGEWADFVLVTVDPLLAPVATLRQGRVMETYIAGHKVWSAGDPGVSAATMPEIGTKATIDGR